MVFTTAISHLTTEIPQTGFGFDHLKGTPFRKECPSFVCVSTGKARSIIFLEDCRLSSERPHFQHKFWRLYLPKRLLTTCLPTDSENRPAGDFSLPAGRFSVIQLAFRLHRFLAWKVVMVRSLGFPSCGLISALAIPWSIFTAARCLISSVTWE